MPTGQYRINTPTLVLIVDGDHHDAHTVPKGAIITVSSKPFGGSRLIEVMWNNKKAMMFPQDLRSRGEELPSTAAMLSAD